MSEVGLGIDRVINKQDDIKIDIKGNPDQDGEHKHGGLDIDVIKQDGGKHSGKPQGDDHEQGKVDSLESKEDDDEKVVEEAMGEIGDEAGGEDSAGGVCGVGAVGGVAHEEVEDDPDGGDD